MPPCMVDVHRPASHRPRPADQDMWGGEGVSSGVQMPCPAIQELTVPNRSTAVVTSGVQMPSRGLPGVYCP